MLAFDRTIPGSCLFGMLKQGHSSSGLANHQLCASAVTRRGALLFAQPLSRSPDAGRQPGAKVEYDGYEGALTVI